MAEELDRLKSLLADEAAKETGLHPQEAKAKGLCFVCGQPALPRCYSDAGRREFQISGTCELCFDAMFQED